jgi:hypothetical protein
MSYHLNYTPLLFESNTIVPDGVPQVGCIVLDAVGTAGGSGTAFIITDDDIVTQVLSLVL